MDQIRTAYLLCTRITLETTALRVISGDQAPDRIGPNDSAIPPRGGITLQATALRVISSAPVLL